MRTSWRHTTVVGLVAALWATGCGGDVVFNAMSPQQARAQVMDSAEELVRDLGVTPDDLVEATFEYESCTDENKGPFRGHVYLAFWMPGAERTQRADPATVRNAMQQLGWQGNPDFHSHAMTLKKDHVDAVVNVVRADPPPVAHVLIDLSGECRDTYDHAKDPYVREDIRAELHAP